MLICNNVDFTICVLIIFYLYYLCIVQVPADAGETALKMVEMIIGKAKL